MSKFWSPDQVRLPDKAAADKPLLDKAAADNSRFADKAAVDKACSR